MIDVRYCKKDNSETRKEKATLRIKIKVAVLERWVQDGGVPTGKSCPSNITKFNKWEDEKLEMEVMLDGVTVVISGVFPVSTVSTDKREHSALKERALILINELKNISSPKWLKKEIRKLEAEKKEALTALQRITNEFTEMRYKIVVLEETNEAKDGTIDNLKDRNAELVRRLGQRPTSIQGQKEV